MIWQGTKVRLSILVYILTPASIMVPVVAIMAHNRAQICAPSCVCLFGVYVGLPWIAIPFPFLLPPLSAVDNAIFNITNPLVR